MMFGGEEKADDVISRPPVPAVRSVVLSLATAGLARSFALAEAALNFIGNDVECGGDIGAGFLGTDVLAGNLVEHTYDKLLGRRACADLTDPDAGSHGARLVLRDAADFLLNGAIELGGESHAVGRDEDIYVYSPG